MEQISEAMTQIREKMSNHNSELSSDDYIKKQVEWENNRKGNLEGYDCHICKNKGYIVILTENNQAVQDCECMKIRRCNLRIERSGLKNLMEEYTFKNYITNEPWQKKAKAMAERFITDYQGKWFYAGGQVGSGKTHLCAALVCHFLKEGKAATYMLWRDEIVSIKSVVTDDDAYSKKMNELKKIPVLYIDDFFKTERGKQPTTADINIAFELLNYRYNNRDLITIISSELLIDDLINIDEAVGSRIYQRVKDYCLVINYDRSKNYRLK